MSDRGCALAGGEELQEDVLAINLSFLLDDKIGDAMATRRHADTRTCMSDADRTLRRRQCS